MFLNMRHPGPGPKGFGWFWSIVPFSNGKNWEVSLRPAAGRPGRPRAHQLARLQGGPPQIHGAMASNLRTMYDDVEACVESI